MKLKKLSLIIAGAALALSAQAVNVDQNFDGFATGTYLGSNAPSQMATNVGAFVWSTNFNGQITTAQLSSDAADHALFVNPLTNAAGMWLQYRTAAANYMTQGVFSASFRIATGNVGISVGGNGTGSPMHFNLSGAQIGIYRTGVGYTYFDQPVVRNTDYVLSITFNADTDTFYGTINGTRLTAGGADVFAFTTLATGLRDFTFSAGTAASSFYIDDLKVRDAVTLGLFTISGR